MESKPYLTDGVRSILPGSVRTGCGRLGRWAADASSVGRPSCNPSFRRDCMRRWDLHEEKRLLSGVRRCPRAKSLPEIYRRYWRSRRPITANWNLVHATADMTFHLARIVNKKVSFASSDSEFLRLGGKSLCSPCFFDSGGCQCGLPVRLSATRDGSACVGQWLPQFLFGCLQQNRKHRNRY